MLAPSPARQALRPAATRSPAPRDRFWWLLLPSLTALALLTRLPSFLRPLWSPDEGYLATQARMLAAGGTLYETVVDRKTPLVPWLYEGAFALFGDTALTPLRLLAVLAWTLTAALTAALARRHTDERTAATSGVLCLLLSLGLNPGDSQSATFEVFILPATVAAVLCADRGRWTGAGLAVAAAFLTKQTGAAVLLPVLWLWWHRAAPPRRPRALAALLLAATLPVLLAALLTAPSGFLFWTVTGSGAYLSFSGSGLFLAARALASAGLLALAGAGLAPAVLAALRARRTGTGTGWLWLWLAASALSTAVGLRFFGHYYLQLVPPLALLGAAALRPRSRRAHRDALALCAGCCALFLLWGALAPRTELAHAERLSAEVGARTAPGERVLLWSMHPETYWLADRTPASRYLTAGLLTNFGGGREGSARTGESYAVPGAWAVLRRELATHPPALIVDDSRGRPYGLDRTPTLRALVHARYAPVGKVDGAVLYARARRQG